MTDCNQNKPGYKETKIGWIPEDWKAAKIRSIATLVGGFGFSKDEQGNKDNVDTPFIKVSDMNLIGNEKYINHSNNYVTNSQIESLHWKPLPMNTIVFAKVGAALLLNRRRILKQKTLIDNNMMGVIPNKRIQPEYLYFLLQNIDFGRIVNIGALPSVNQAQVGSIRIPVPPLPEQRKIAEILSTWDKAIELVGKQIDVRQRLKKGLMQQLLVGKMRFPVFIQSDAKQETKFGDLPLDWNYVPISKIAEQVLDQNDNGDDLPVLSCTKYVGLVDSLKYFGKQVFSKDTSAYKVVRRGYFAYATNHIEEGSIGYQDLYDKGLVSPMYTVFHTNEKVDDVFLYKLLKTELYRHIFEINTNASVNRRGSLRWNGFSKIKIPLPSTKEQLALAAVLDTFEREIEINKKQLDLLENQKQGLMQKLLTGEVRVKV